MGKRNAGSDLEYANIVLGECTPTDGFEEAVIIRHWIPWAAKAERKAKRRKAKIKILKRIARNPIQAILSEMHRTTFYANRAALWHRLAKRLNGNPDPYAQHIKAQGERIRELEKEQAKPKGQWLRGTPEKAGYYHMRDRLYWGVYYWDDGRRTDMAEPGSWRSCYDRTKMVLSPTRDARFHSIPIEIPPLPEETNEG